MGGYLVWEGLGTKAERQGRKLHTATTWELGQLSHLIFIYFLLFVILFNILTGEFSMSLDIIYILTINGGNRT